MQKQFQSTVGFVVDIATPSKGKLRALGFLWVLIALLPIAVINYLIIQALTSSEPLVTSKPITFLGSLLMPVMAWFALGNAVQRFRAATEDRYFRAGPGGISVCVTDDYAGGTFRFSLKNLKFDLPWDRIKTWYPFVESMNGIPTERALVFETLENERIKVKTYHFAESQKQIVASIARSRSIVTEDLLGASIEQDEQEGQEFPLPKSAREVSFEIKKKRDPITEVDLTTMVQSERAVCVERVADALGAKLMSLCPRADGFRLSRKVYRPFKEWRDVIGIRLFVRRGLLYGYEIQVEPSDSETRRLMISMCPSSLVSDIRKFVMIGVGVVFLLISFGWLNTVGYWLGDFAELTPIVMVAVCLAVVAVSGGLLQLPISLLRLLCYNKEREAAQKQEIKDGIQGMQIEPCGPLARRQ